MICKVAVFADVMADIVRRCASVPRFTRLIFNRRTGCQRYAFARTHDTKAPIHRAAALAAGIM